MPEYQNLIIYTYTGEPRLQIGVNNKIHHLHRQTKTFG